MEFFRKLFGLKRLDDRLFGKWKVDKNDAGTIKALGDVKMKFTPKGELIYEIRRDDKTEIINMIFDTAENIITTDQPSASRKERTEYSFLSGKLILRFNGIKTVFVRVLEDDKFIAILNLSDPQRAFDRLDDEFIDIMYPDCVIDGSLIMLLEAGIDPAVAENLNWLKSLLDPKLAPLGETEFSIRPTEPPSYPAD